MSFVHRAQYFSVIFILLKLSGTQIIERKFRSSDIELVPNIVILNSTSRVDFFCINHYSDDSSLLISLSKNISNDQLKILTKQLNKTTIHIKIQLRNYIGIFHLFCHLEDKQYEGTRADVIVKAETGMIQLTEQCQVYNRQYIKCYLRAPNIARAIQNDFPYEFEFTEIPNLQSYNKHYEFLKNESVDKDLIFKWTPIVDDQFPNGVIMNIKVVVPHFGTSQYRFNMSPIFLVKPNFVLRNPSKNKIELQLTSISLPTICEKSIQSKTNLNINRTWTIVESDRTNIIINDLLLNTTYQICMRCRPTSNNSYGNEECQKIRTLSKFSIETKRIYLMTVIILSLIILIMIFSLIYILCRKKQNKRRTHDEPVNIDLINVENEEYILPTLGESTVPDFEENDLPLLQEKYLPLMQPMHLPVIQDKYTRLYLREHE